MLTGFDAFHIYSIIKNIYYKSNKYEQILIKLPRKEQLLKSWNTKRKDKDGIYFYNLQKYIPKNKFSYMRLFSYYYLLDENFHVSTIFHDEFKIWKKNEFELNNLKLIVQNDFYK